ncbi:MAG TPA: NADH-quinone oxidoreductase subunit H [Elusimicrobiales bacterium]|nr:NADH-quinone oxidoreductase subunit H [Elusimicrobiales bacterium]
MPEKSDSTFFMCPEKEGMEVVRRQHQAITSIPLLRPLLDSMLNLVAILNSKRQLVFANTQFLKTFNRDLDSILGLRGGEIFKCAHAAQNCGTSKYCLECGAAKVMDAALNHLNQQLEECDILPEKAGDEINLLVYGTPFEHQKERFMLLAAVDTSSAKRKAVLERLFFHDLINTASGIKGLLALMAANPTSDWDQYVKLAATGAETLVEQILSQKDLSAAERGELQPTFTTVSSLDMLNGVAALFRNLDVGLIFILAMVGVSIVGVLLAGWASNNKWSVYGAMREACQMVSYEIPMGMSLLVPIMTAGTPSISMS